MSPVDPRVVEVLTDLVRGLRLLKIPFCVIGALVPELLIEAPPRRFTNDADVTVVLESLEDFDRLKTQLADFGFTAAPNRPYRLTHRSGGWCDLLPYSAALVPDGTLHLDRDLSFNMAGFDRVMANAVQVDVTGELRVPVIPIPLYAMLKLVAFGDRRDPRDPASVLHCLRNYAEGDDRRYGLDHDGEPVSFEFTTAYSLIFLQPLALNAIGRRITN